MQYFVFFRLPRLVLDTVKLKVRYQKHAVGFLEAKADNLEHVASYMNETFGKPITGSKSKLNSRITIVTPPVIHTLSEYKSIKGVRSHYCYLIQPNSVDVYYRRYTCTSCDQCKNLQFLQCTNTSRGSWKKTKKLHK